MSIKERVRQLQFRTLTKGSSFTIAKGWSYVSILPEKSASITNSEDQKQSLEFDSSLTLGPFSDVLMAAHTITSIEGTTKVIYYS